MNNSEIHPNLGGGQQPESRPPARTPQEFIIRAMADLSTRQDMAAVSSLRELLNKFSEGKTITVLAWDEREALDAVYTPEEIGKFFMVSKSAVDQGRSEAEGPDYSQPGDSDS